MQKYPYHFSVVVHGRTLEEYSHEGETWIEGRKGSEFILKFRNNSGETCLVVPTVDGLSVIDGEEASFKSSGYIVGPCSQVEIDGWRTSRREVRAFEFVSLENSYAKRTGQGGNVGVIGAAVFLSKNWEKNYTNLFQKQLEVSAVTNDSPTKYGLMDNSSWSNTSVNACTNYTLNYARVLSNSPQSSIGTGWGAKKDSHVLDAPFERRDSPVELFELRYADIEYLEKNEIVRGKIKGRISAFPNENVKFCPPPTR